MSLKCRLFAGVRQAISDNVYGAVISDMSRNDKPLDGITLVKQMRRRNDLSPFILYTVVPSAAQGRLVAQAGGQADTVTPSELYAAVVPRVAVRQTKQ